MGESIRRYFYHTKINHTSVNSNTWLPYEAYNPRINFCDKEDITYLSFDEWVVLYNADPEGWHILNDNDVDEKEIPYITCPAYCFPPDRKKFQIIKFCKKRDFRKWIHFIKKMKNDGQDFENLQEYQKLLQCAQKVASERVEKSKAEVEKQYDEMRKLLKKNTSSVFDNVQTTPIPTLVFKNGKTFIREIDENGVIHLRER